MFYKEIYFESPIPSFEDVFEKIRLNTGYEVLIKLFDEDSGRILIDPFINDIDIFLTKEPFGYAISSFIINCYTFQIVSTAIIDLGGHERINSKIPYWSREPFEEVSKRAAELGLLTN